MPCVWSRVFATRPHTNGVTLSFEEVAPAEVTAAKATAARVAAAVWQTTVEGCLVDYFCLPRGFLWVVSGAILAAAAGRTQLVILGVFCARYQGGYASRPAKVNLSVTGFWHDHTYFRLRVTCRLREAGRHVFVSSMFGENNSTPDI